MFNKDQILVLLNIYLKQIFNTINYPKKDKEFTRLMNYANFFLSKYPNFTILTNNVILTELESKFEPNFNKISRIDNLIYHFQNCKLILRCDNTYFYLSLFKNSEQISYFYIQKTI